MITEGAQVIHTNLGYGTVVECNGSMLKVQFATGTFEVASSSLQQSINS